MVYNVTVDKMQPSCQKVATLAALFFTAVCSVGQRKANGGRGRERSGGSVWEIRGK